MTRFSPDAFVGRAAVELEAFFDKVDQDSLVLEWHGRVEWREQIKVQGGGGIDYPTEIPSWWWFPDVFPDHIGTDLPEDHPPISVPNVDILKYLGGGQFGWVYAAKVRTTGHVVALKILRNDRGSDTPRTAANEAIMGAKLKHRNIMGVFDLRPIGRYWIILMELVAGKNLTHAQIQSHEIEHILGSLSDAVYHMGQAKVVHRDLKPSNVVLRRTDRSPVIVDLGLSVDLNVIDPKDAGFAGTPLYMPPEAFEGLITTAFDSYSLGVTAAQVLTGESPIFPGRLNELYECKRSGSFREALVKMLQGTEEPIANWIGRMTENDLAARLAALDEGREWGKSRSGAVHDPTLPRTNSSK